MLDTKGPEYRIKTFENKKSSFLTVICIVINSFSGKTARLLSRFRSPTDIMGTTTSIRAWRQLNLSWGVTPVLSEEYSSLDIVFFQALNQAKNYLIFKAATVLL